MIWTTSRNPWPFSETANFAGPSPGPASPFFQQAVISPERTDTPLRKNNLNIDSCKGGIRSRKGKEEQYKLFPHGS
jgi:hypothetical protein